MIERYSWGSMTIDGRRYRSDLVIWPDGRVAEGWRRTRGHGLGFEDIADLAGAHPEIIVCGCGFFGLVKPAAGLERDLAELGIRFMAARSRAAAKIYNEWRPEHRVGACFHLTC